LAFCNFANKISQYTQVTGVNTRFCKLAILAVEGCPLNEPFRGTLRKEDIRATEKDKVEIYKSFRPGDIVQARVSSLGDSHSYSLSTAENELGVIFAMSEAGESQLFLLYYFNFECQN
jgi:exosome complex component CSL4